MEEVVKLVSIREYFVQFALQLHEFESNQLKLTLLQPKSHEFNLTLYEVARGYVTRNQKCNKNGNMSAAYLGTGMQQNM